MSVQCQCTPRPWEDQMKKQKAQKLDRAISEIGHIVARHYHARRAEVERTQWRALDELAELTAEQDIIEGSLATCSKILAQVTE